MTLKPFTLILAASALALAVTPALAEKGGNGKGNGGGNGNGQSAQHSQSASQGGGTQAGAKPGKGGLASELKGLNAVKANPNALENAAPNSQVGRIAAYRDAALVTGEKAAALAQAREDLAGLPAPTRTLTEIEAEIAALDPAAVDYADKLAALEAEKAATESYADAAAIVAAAEAELEAAAEAEHAALLTASNGRELSDEAIAYIRDVLNL